MNGQIPEGWMKPEELAWLFNRASRMTSVVEIGSWKGRSTYALLSACKGPVYAIDHWQGSHQALGPTNEAARQGVFEEFKTNVGHFPNLQIMKMASVEAAEFFRPKSVDMVFIDGDHIKEAFFADLQAWKCVAKKLLCGHDCNWVGVMSALKESGIPFVETGIGSLWKYEIS